MNDEIRPITFDDLLTLASRVTIPDVVDHGNSINTGQLWLAKWDTFREFVFVAHADASHPVVVPVTFDDAHELDEPEILQSSKLGTGRAHWATPRPIPAIALDNLIDAEVRVADATAAATGVDPRSEELWTDLKAFDEGGSGLLSTRFREAGTTPSQLARRLDVSSGEALDLIRGRLLPTLPMAESIANLLGISPETVLGLLHPIPTGLRRDLTKRRFRASVRERARQRQWSDSAAWKQVAFGTLAMPYRTTGGSADDEWESRIERYLEVDHDY